MKKLLIGALLAGAAGTVAADTMDDLLRQVQESRAQESRVDRERVARFLADKNQQQKLLADTKAALAKAEADSQALRAEFAANETRLGELQAELKKRSGELAEVFTAEREFAGKLRTDLKNSLVSAQFPGRAETLAEGRELPGIPQLENLWVNALREMAESGKTVKFRAKVTDAAGEERDVDVFRIGAFSAFADGKYLRYAPDTGKLSELSLQPDHEYLSLVKNLQGNGDKPVKIAVDPSRGAMLDNAAQAPAGYTWLPKSLRGLVANGVDLGIFGVLLLASIWALAVACERWTFFRRVDVGLYPNRAALETELTRHLTVIGTVAANAPYVGLLGTVLGIMMTFHRMGTEKGSMDVHSIMLGLSTALKATAIGLMVALPCVLLNNLLRRRIRELVTTYEVRHGS
jgi:biopolymer transport protein ExbB